VRSDSILNRVLSDYHLIILTEGESNEILY
jgi:hypothetical protein